jgi:hypothetical protein
MKKTILISKHIHSCFASFSSNDARIRVFTTEDKIDFLVTPSKPISGSKKFPFLNGETIKEVEGDDEFTAIYVESDETFYQLALRSGKGIIRGNEYHNTPEFFNLVKSYTDKGWSLEKRGDKNKAQEAYWERCQVREEEADKAAGLVLWKRYDNRVPADYQGGFSNEVFNVKELQDYVKDGGVFGWIGHSVRHPEHDKLIEAGLRERGLSPKAMFNWISSSDGRHFGDALEGFTLDEQLHQIKQYLNRIFNLCLIYGSSRHKGTMQSTNEIKADLEQEGILLPEGKMDYDPNGWMKLMTLALAAGNKNLPEEVKEMLPKLADEVLNKKKKK